jgi:hypothetical protein
MNITTSATSLVSIRLVERTHSWLAAFGKLRTRFEVSAQPSHLDPAIVTRTAS